MHDFCLANLGPIALSVKDTNETIRQVEKVNAWGITNCGWKVH